MTDSRPLVLIIGRDLIAAEARAWDQGVVLVLAPDLLRDDQVFTYDPADTNARTAPGMLLAGSAFVSGSELPNPM